MIKPKKHNDIEYFKTLYSENKAVKYTTFILGGVLLIYLSGKAFNGVASLIRSYNNMKSAYNGK